MVYILHTLSSSKSTCIHDHYYAGESTEGQSVSTEGQSVSTFSHPSCMTRSVQLMLMMSGWRLLPTEACSKTHHHVRGEG
jgi:hypothetical protein